MTQQIVCRKCDYIGEPVMWVAVQQPLVPWHYPVDLTEGGDYLSGLTDVAYPCNGSQAPGR